MKISEQKGEIKGESRKEKGERGEQKAKSNKQ